MEISLSLFTKYSAYRDRMKDEEYTPAEWRGADLMEAFIQTMWEECDPRDPFDDGSWSTLGLDEWRALDRLYTRKRKGSLRKKQGRHKKILN